MSDPYGSPGTADREDIIEEEAREGWLEDLELKNLKVAAIGETGTDDCLATPLEFGEPCPGRLWP